MKYILLPVFRLLFVVFRHLLLTLIYYSYAILFSLWNWNFDTIIEVYQLPFLEDTIYHSVPGEMYWKYETAWDYLKQNKTYTTKL